MQLQEILSEIKKIIVFNNQHWDFSASPYLAAEAIATYAKKELDRLVRVQVQQASPDKATPQEIENFLQPFIRFLENYWKKTHVRTDHTVYHERSYVSLPNFFPNIMCVALAIKIAKIKTEIAKNKADEKQTPSMIALLMPTLDGEARNVGLETVAEVFQGPNVKLGHYLCSDDGTRLIHVKDCMEEAMERVDGKAETLDSAKEIFSHTFLRPGDTTYPPLTPFERQRLQAYSPVTITLFFAIEEFYQYKAHGKTPSVGHYLWQFMRLLKGASAHETNNKYVETEEGEEKTPTQWEAGSGKLKGNPITFQEGIPKFTKFIRWLRKHHRSHYETLMTTTIHTKDDRATAEGDGDEVIRDYTFREILQLTTRVVQGAETENNEFGEDTPLVLQRGELERNPEYCTGTNKERLQTFLHQHQIALYKMQLRDDPAHGRLAGVGEEKPIEASTFEDVDQDDPETLDQRKEEAQALLHPDHFPQSPVYTPDPHRFREYFGVLCQDASFYQEIAEPLLVSRIDKATNNFIHRPNQEEKYRNEIGDYLTALEVVAPVSADQKADPPMLMCLQKCEQKRLRWILKDRWDSSNNVAVFFQRLKTPGGQQAFIARVKQDHPDLLTPERLKEEIFEHHHFCFFKMAEVMGLALANPMTPRNLLVEKLNGCADTQACLDFLNHQNFFVLLRDFIRPPIKDVVWIRDQVVEQDRKDAFVERIRAIFTILSLAQLAALYDYERDVPWPVVLDDDQYAEFMAALSPQIQRAYAEAKINEDGLTKDRVLSILKVLAPENYAWFLGLEIVKAILTGDTKFSPEDFIQILSEQEKVSRDKGKLFVRALMQQQRWQRTNFLRQSLLHHPVAARWALYGALESYLVERASIPSTYISWLGRLFGYRGDKKIEAAEALQAVILEEAELDTLDDHKAALTQGHLGEIYLYWQQVMGLPQDEPPFFPAVNHAWRYAIDTWLYRFKDVRKLLEKLDGYFFAAWHSFIAGCCTVLWNITLGSLMLMIGIVSGLYTVIEGIIELTLYSIKTAATYLLTFLLNLFTPQRLYTWPYKIASTIMWPVSFLFDRIMNVVESITSPIQTVFRPFYECYLYYRPRTMVLMSVLGVLLATFCILSIVFSMGASLPAALLFLQPVIHFLSPALLWMAQGITVLGVKIVMSILAYYASFSVVMHTFFYPQVKKAQIEEVLNQDNYTARRDGNAYSEWLRDNPTKYTGSPLPDRTTFFHHYRSCLHDVVPWPLAAVQMAPLVEPNAPEEQEGQAAPVVVP